MATVAEWISFYVADHGNEPQNIPQFMRYVQNRDGPLTYREVREAFQAARTASTEFRQSKQVEHKSFAHERHWQRVDGFDEGDCCAICLDDDNDNCIELNCGGHHRFHLACMGAFVAHTFKSECPTCRRPCSGEGVSASLPLPLVSGTDATPGVSS